MSTSKSAWIDLTARQPKRGQFVRVEVREQVEHHVLNFEGQARYDGENGWLRADGAPYLRADQEIRRWKPLLDGSGHDEWDEFLGHLSRED